MSGSRIPQFSTLRASTPAPLSSPISGGGAPVDRNNPLRCSAGTLNSKVNRTDNDSERVKVYARIRPALREDETPGALAWSEEDGRLTLSRPDAPVPQSDFVFSKVLGPNASQADVYSTAVSDVVADVLRGYNGTILAYGQTGAGKTYTLGNTAPDAIGMIPRAAAELFMAASRDPVHTYRITMSYIQIYMEMIQDLLNPTADNLPIREDASGVFVAGACEVPVASLEECLHYLELGERNRVFAFTHLNAHSSRSHAVVMLNVVKGRRYLTSDERAQAEAPDQDGVITQKVTVGRLFMVDLAGSERLKKSKSVGLRATEARSINLSLTMLGMCISARAQDSPHVPFRDSKLTRLLQESLGGNAKTSLILCLSDVRQHADESLQSLQFGSRAACVRNKPMVNERQLRRQLTAELLAALEQGHERVDGLEAALTQTKEERDALQAALARERARSVAIAEALRMEAEARQAAAQAQLAEQAELLSTHVQQLGQVQQQQGQLEQEVARLREEQRSRDEAHQAEVTALRERLLEVQKAAVRDREAAAADAQSQRARLVAVAQRQTTALSARLTQERASAREQATSIHLALTMLQRALGELAGRPMLTSSDGSAPASAPGPLVVSVPTEESQSGAKLADAGGRSQWLAGLAAAVAAAKSRRASGSNGSTGGGVSAVQAIQEALGLNADASEGPAVSGSSDSDGSSLPIGDATAHVQSLAPYERGPTPTDSTFDTATSALAAVLGGGGGGSSGHDRTLLASWYEAPIGVTSQSDGGVSPGKAAAYASEGGMVPDKAAVYASDGGMAVGKAAAYASEGGVATAKLAANIFDGGLTSGRAVTYASEGGVAPGKLAANISGERHCSSDLAELDAALAAARQDLLADMVAERRVAPDPTLEYPGAMALPPPQAPPPLASSISLMLPTPPAGARGHSRGSASDRYPAAGHRSGAVSPAPVSPGYGQIYARRNAGYDPASEQPSLTAVAAGAARHPVPAHRPSLVSSFIRDGVVVSCGGAHTSAQAPDVSTLIPRSSVLNLNPAFEAFDLEGAGSGEVIEHSAADGASRAGLEVGFPMVNGIASSLSSDLSAGPALRASAVASPGGLFPLGLPAEAPPAASPLFAGIQVQLGALMEAVAAAKRSKADLEGRVAQQASELERMQEQQKLAETGAIELSGQLQASRDALATTEAQLAATCAELEDSRRALGEATRALAEARAELQERGEALQATRGRLDDTAGQLQEAVTQLEEAGRALRASAEEGRRLQQEMQQTQDALAAEAAALHSLEAATARSREAAVEALVRRQELQRQARAANLIKQAFLRAKILKLKGELAAKQQALTTADVHRREREAAQASRQAAQAAQAGQALVQESVSVMRDAVESILTAFVGRKYELEARRSLHGRVARVLSPAQPPRPSQSQPAAGPGAGAQQAASSSNGRPSVSALMQLRNARRSQSLYMMLAAATAAPSKAPEAAAAGQEPAKDAGEAAEAAL